MGDASIRDQFYDCIVRNAACVLGGVKPAALFNFIPRVETGQKLGSEKLAPGTDPAARAALARTSCQLARDLTARHADLRADVMFVTTGRALLLVSRPSRLADLLADPAAARYLADAGYDTSGCDGLVAALHGRILAFEHSHAAGVACRRDCATCTFPHEVGLLLGYPLEDVRGFIENGGRGAVAVGPWKAYGDAAAAQRRWERLRSCRQAVIRNYAHGTPFEALIA